jgi:hypothetical protein
MTASMTSPTELGARSQSHDPGSLHSIVHCPQLVVLVAVHDEWIAPQSTSTLGRPNGHVFEGPQKCLVELLEHRTRLGAREDRLDSTYGV